VRHAYRVLHSFGGSGDGMNPYAGLIDVNGTLYGTTVKGGANNWGTVFEISGTGTEKVLYSFEGSGGAVQPEAGLIDIKGTLYGTTRAGGAYFLGTVFSITTGGTEKLLHSFGYNYTDGVWPYAALIDVKGTLYGTTQQGGPYPCGYSFGCGTVFSVTTDGSEKVLYTFGKHRDDGNLPVAGLLDVNGTLYGTTPWGGKYERGTVFSISTTGTEHVLYSFGASGISDGTEPLAALIDVKGTLYGTTYEGGANHSGSVFSITTGGTEKLVYSFNGSGGSWPIGGLINVKGVLYGTTSQGGVYNDGTVFSVTTGGNEEVLHSFGKGTDGKSPQASLVQLNGILYGTTYEGGTNHRRSGGDGTVFALMP
jgi:uncharacterized repeat protein (TIGR03803 family)